MSVWGYVLGAVLAVVAILIILVIILQQGNQQGVGVVSGIADSYLSKNKARSIDAKLARATKLIAALFIVFVLALNVLSYFGVL